MDKLNAEFKNEFSLTNFGTEASVAIVKGATLFNRYNLKKTIDCNIGVEVLWPLDRKPAD